MHCAFLALAVASARVGTIIEVMVPITREQTSISIMVKAAIRRLLWVRFKFMFWFCGGLGFGGIGRKRSVTAISWGFLSRFWG